MNSERIRPSRPAPAIPQGLANRRSAPQASRRQSAQENVSQQPQAAPRRSAPTLARQESVEDNVRVKMLLSLIKAIRTFNLAFLNLGYGLLDRLVV